MLERGVVVCVCVYACMHVDVEYRDRLCKQWKGRHSGACECDDRSGSIMSRSNVCGGLVEDVRMREEHRMERGPDQAQGS